MRANFLGPYLSNITRAACILFHQHQLKFLYLGDFAPKPIQKKSIANLQRKNCTEINFWGQYHQSTRRYFLSKYIWDTYLHNFLNFCA